MMGSTHLKHVCFIILDLWHETVLQLANLCAIQHNYCQCIHNFLRKSLDICIVICAAIFVTVSGLSHIKQLQMVK